MASHIAVSDQEALSSRSGLAGSQEKACSLISL